ncbi:MAG: hypothetical protein LC623_03980 [Halobacteriales archaeon]|nr:hypothetical protein [Halobacteriales archaeon]
MRLFDRPGPWDPHLVGEMPLRNARQHVEFQHRPLDFHWPLRRVHLAKYSRSPIRVVHPRSMEGSIPFTIDGKPLRAREGAFLTAGEWLDPPMAANVLALTYSPSHGALLPGPATWDDAACSHERHEGGHRALHTARFQNLFGKASSFNRAWPAYGRPGGGLETLLVEGALFPCDQREWDSAPGDEEEHMMATQAEFAGVTQGLSDMLEGTERNLLADSPTFAGQREEDRRLRRAVQRKEEGVSAGLESRGAGMVVSFSKVKPLPGGTAKVLYRLHGAWWADAIPYRVVHHLPPLDVPASEMEVLPGMPDPGKVQNQAASMRDRIQQAMYQNPMAKVWVMGSPWHQGDV